MKVFNNFEKSIINKYAYNFNDTGSHQIQVILFSIKIKKMIIHINNNKKDLFIKKSYIILKSKINRFLKYLKKKKYNLYNELINDIKHI